MCHFQHAIITGRTTKLVARQRKGLFDQDQFYAK